MESYNSDENVLKAYMGTEMYSFNPRLWHCVVFDSFNSRYLKISKLYSIEFYTKMCLSFTSVKMENSSLSFFSLEGAVCSPLLCYNSYLLRALRWETYLRSALPETGWRNLPHFALQLTNLLGPRTELYLLS